MVHFVRIGRPQRLVLLSLLPKQAKCAEIGVWKGEFSRLILANTKPEKLHLIDPWQFCAEYPGRYYGGAVAKSQGDMDKIFAAVRAEFAANDCVEIHREPSVACLAKFDDGYFDWVYVDGNHSFEYVVADLESAYLKVRDGGYIAGDEFGWRDRSGAAEGQTSGVSEAVRDFADGHGIAKVYLIQDQFLIQVPSDRGG